MRQKKMIEIKSKLRTGDKVVVVAGNDKGKVSKILARKASKFIVEGVNVRKKHVRRREGAADVGVIEIELPIHPSNLMAANEAGKPVKLKTRVNGDGSRELYYLEEGRSITYRTLSKKS